jgi:fructose-specific component phosphotransferase system IIB-like protein
MAVTIEVLRYGLRTPATRGRMICPECGQPMKTFYQNRYKGPKGVYAQCMSPECPHLKDKQETKMPTETAVKQEFQLIPTGDYLCQVTNYEIVDTSYEGKPTKQYQFTLEIVQPKAFAGKTRCYWCNKVLSTGTKKSKLWRFVETAFNRPIVIGESIDIDDLVGRQMVATITVETTDQKDDSGELIQRNKTAGINPYKKQPPFEAPKTAKAAKAETPDAAEPKPSKEDDEFDPFAEE